MSCEWFFLVFLFYFLFLQKKNMKKLFCIFLLLFILNSFTSNAATRTWSGAGSGTVAWSGNWGVNPVGGDDIVITTTGTLIITGMPSLSLNSITINGGSNFTVEFRGANTLTVGGNAGTDFTIASSTGFILSATNPPSITMAASSTSSISGTFTIRSGCTWTMSNASVVNTVNSGGSIVNYGTITGATTAKLIFEGNSSYDHARNGGTIPTADWNGAANTATSTCNVTGMTSTKPGGLVTTSNTFYNFVWNCPSQSTYLVTGFQGSFAASGENFTCLGDFTLTSSNGYEMAFSDVVGGALSTFSVSGNMVVSDGYFEFNANTTSVIANIGGSLTVSGGFFMGLYLSTGTTTVNIGTDLVVSGGDFRGSEGSGGTCTFNISRDVLVSSGSFSGTEAAGDATFNITRNVTVSGGLFYGSSGTGGDFTGVIGGTLTISGGDFYGTDDTGVPTFTISGSLTVTSGSFIGTYSATTANYTITGNISVSGGWFYGTYDAGSPAYTISGDILVSGGTFYGTDYTGDPTFSVRDITVSNTGTFIGSNWAGGVPVFTITRNWATSGASALVRFSSSSSGGTYAISGNFTVSNGWTTVSYSTGSPTITVGGDFTVSGGNFAGSEVTSGAPTISITGNFLVSGGTFYGASWTATGNPIFNITGNSTISAGTFNGTALTGDPTFNMTGSLTTSGTAVFYATTASGGLPIFNIQGSVDLSGGTTAGSSSFASTSPMSTFNLTGASSNNLTLKTGLTYNTTAAWSWNISSGRTVTLLSNVEVGGTASSCIFTNNGTLIMGTYTFPAITTAAASFVNASGATLRTGHLSGLSTTAATGAIQVTGTKTFSSAASYVFNGVAAQVTGNFGASTTPTASTVANLEFNNSSGVTLTAGLTVANSGTLTLTSGYHDIGTFTLQLGTSAANTLSYAAGGIYSSTDNGSFRRWIPTGAVTSTSGNYYGLFPFRKSATNLNVFEINSTSNITTAGFINLVPKFTSSSLDIVDYADDNATVQRIDPGKIVTVTFPGALAGGSFTVKMSGGNYALGGTLSHCTLVTYTGAVRSYVGTWNTATGTVFLSSGNKNWSDNSKSCKCIRDGLLQWNHYCFTN
jgi:hypothetical protein